MLRSFGSPPRMDMRDAQKVPHTHAQAGPICPNTRRAATFLETTWSWRKGPNLGKPTSQAEAQEQDFSSRMALFAENVGTRCDQSYIRLRYSHGSLPTATCRHAEADGTIGTAGTQKIRCLT